MALDYFNKRDSLVIETKRDLQDVVSIADRNVETLLRERVAAAFGDDGFLGRSMATRTEVPVTPGSSTRSTNRPFVNGMPSWCVSIAVVRDGAPVIGIINVPCSKEIYASAEGHGATLNGTRLKLDPSRNLQTL